MVIYLEKQDIASHQLGISAPVRSTSTQSEKEESGAQLLSDLKCSVQFNNLHPGLGTQKSPGNIQPSCKVHSSLLESVLENISEKNWVITVLMFCLPIPSQALWPIPTEKLIFQTGKKMVKPKPTSSIETEKSLISAASPQIHFPLGSQAA